MFKSPLKVFGEYLIPKTAAAATLTGTNVVRAGKSMSGIEIVVCIEEYNTPGATPVNLTVGNTVTITISNSQDGTTFTALPAWADKVKAPEKNPTATTIPAKPGTIIARMTLPYDCKPYIKGNLAFGGTAPACNVSMFPAYLPR